MTFEEDRPPAAEDTFVVDGEEVTQGDEEWPVAEQYRVESEDTHRRRDAGVIARSTVPPPARRRFPPDLGPGLLLATLLATLAVIGLAAFLTTRGDDDSGTRPPTDTSGPTPGGDDTSTTSTTPAPDARKPLPDVRGVQLAKARAQLEEAGLRVRVRRASSDRPAGEVLRQAPPAGASLDRGALVVLTVAGEPKAVAPKLVAVPGVVGFSSSDAVVAVRDTGLVPRIRLVSSSQPSGIVVAQMPVEGTDLARGGSVRLDVARNEPRATTPTRVDVPDVVGTDVSDARSRLRELDLRSEVVRVSSEQPVGTVVSQSPQAGAELRKERTVTLRVSSGPSSVDVPDVTGLDEAAARLEVESAGFEVRVTDESTTDPAHDGIVVRQSPSGGSAVPEGAVVTLTVARFD